MPIKSHFSTKGLEEYLEKIGRAGEKIGEVVDRALEAGGQVLVDGMLRRAPEETGNLKENIKMIGPETEGFVHFIEVGLHSGTDAETARYANVQEYGSADTPAHPYIRPTMDEDMGKARKAMRDVFKAELES